MDNQFPKIKRIADKGLEYLSLRQYDNLNAPSSDPISCLGLVTLIYEMAYIKKNIAYGIW